MTQETAMTEETAVTEEPGPGIDTRAVARIRLALFTLLAAVVAVLGVRLAATDPPLPANDPAPVVTTVASAPPCAPWTAPPGWGCGEN